VYNNDAVMWSIYQTAYADACSVRYSNSVINSSFFGSVARLSYASPAWWVTAGSKDRQIIDFYDCAPGPVSVLLI